MTHEVICPNCCHQFRAIPVQVQQLMLAAGFEPPFDAAPPAVNPAPGYCPHCKQYTIAEPLPADDEAVRLLTEVAETVPNMSIELEQAINAYLAKVKK